MNRILSVLLLARMLPHKELPPIRPSNIGLIPPLRQLSHLYKSRRTNPNQPTQPSQPASAAKLKPKLPQPFSGTFVMLPSASAPKTSGSPGTGAAYSPSSPEMRSPEIRIAGITHIGGKKDRSESSAVARIHQEGLDSKLASYHAWNSNECALQLMWAEWQKSQAYPLSPRRRTPGTKVNRSFLKVLIWNANSRVNVAPHMAIQGLPCTPYRRLKAAE